MFVKSSLILGGHIVAAVILQDDCLRDGCYTERDERRYGTTDGRNLSSQWMFVMSQAGCGSKASRHLFGGPATSALEGREEWLLVEGEQELKAAETN